MLILFSGKYPSSSHYVFISWVLLDIWKTYSCLSAGDFEQSELIAQCALIVELLQRERQSLLDLSIVRGDQSWTVRTDLHQLGCRNCAEKITNSNVYHKM